jgi:hypothetical protein
LYKTLCKGNSSWDVSIKQNVNFKLKPPAMLIYIYIFFFVAKVVLLKFFHPQKFYQHRKFHGVTLTGEKF